MFLSMADGVVIRPNVNCMEGRGYSWGSRLFDVCEALKHQGTDWERMLRPGLQS